MGSPKGHQSQSAISKDMEPTNDAGPTAASRVSKNLQKKLEKKRMRESMRQKVPKGVKTQKFSKKRVPIPQSALAAIPSPLPAALREQRIVSYDTGRYPFRELIAECLGVTTKELSALHRDPRAEETKGRRGKMPFFQRAWQLSRGSEPRAKFEALLHKFIAEVAAPNMGAGVGTKGVAYQRRATFRVIPPGPAMGVPHVDAEYHHPPSEVNWWIPVTKVWGTNTLHVESAPGRGDFAPVELEYGQALRFFGNCCHHYTVANATDATRVSFDVRVVPLEHHIGKEWRDALGRECIYRVGAYYRRVGVQHDVPRGEKRSEAAASLSGQKNVKKARA
jgi:hypothetical protein